MLLRRITQHVKAQNWTAVGLDFMIVIFGVFIGIQLGNWNAARADRQDYGQAVERYIREAQTNIATLNQLEIESENALARARVGFEVLQTCTDTAESRADLEASLVVVTGTFGVSLRNRALEDLTSQPHLVAQQTEEERQHFADVMFTIGVFSREAEFIERLPLEKRIQDSPLLEPGTLIDRNVTYTGVDYSRKVRALKLAAPISELCRDNELKKAYYTWERWQGTLPVVISIMRTTLQQSLNRLEGDTDT